MSIKKVSSNVSFNVPKGIDNLVSRPSLINNITDDISKKNSVSNNVPGGLANSSNQVETMNLSGISQVNIETASGKHDNYYDKHKYFGSAVIENEDGSWIENVEEFGKEIRYKHNPDGSYIEQIHGKDGKVSISFFTSDGKEKKVDIYEGDESYFDDNGNVVLIKKDNNDEISRKTTYDTNGNIISDYGYRNGNMIKYYELAEDGTICKANEKSYGWEETYYKDDKIISAKEYNFSYELVSNSEHEYSANGDEKISHYEHGTLVSEVTKYSDGTVYTKEYMSGQLSRELVTNSNGDVISKKSYDNNQLTSEYTTDDDGNITVRHINTSGEVTNEKKDANGQMLDKTITDANGNVTYEWTMSDDGMAYEKRIDQNGFMTESTINNGVKTTRSTWPDGNIQETQYVNDQIIAQRRIQPDGTVMDAQINPDGSISWTV